MASMADALTRRGPHFKSLAAVMRQALLSGPKTGTELAAIAKIRPSDVGANLKNDIAMGRVHVTVKGRVGTYELADPNIVARIEAARELLTAYGCKVVMPGRKK